MDLVEWERLYECRCATLSECVKRGNKTQAHALMKWLARWLTMASL